MIPRKLLSPHGVLTAIGLACLAAFILGRGRLSGSAESRSVAHLLHNRDQLDRTVWKQERIAKNTKISSSICGTDSVPPPIRSRSWETPSSKHSS